MRPARLRGGQLLRELLRLQRVQHRTDAAGGRRLLGYALLHEAAPDPDVDAIGVPHGRQPVSDEDHRLTVAPARARIFSNTRTC